MTAEGNRWQQLALKAGAELAIVVVGVTLALWADDWASERGRRALEQTRLQALSENVDQTLAELHGDRADATAAASAIRGLINGKEMSVNESREAIRFGLLYGPAFSPELNVYDDLKNSGELALLTDADLRRSLAQMDSSLELIRLAQEDFSGVQHLQIDSFAVDHTDLGVFYGEDVGLDWRSIDDAAIDEIVNDQRFRNRMHLKLDLVTQIELQFGTAEDVLIDVQWLIQSQLIDN